MKGVRRVVGSGVRWGAGGVVVAALAGVVWGCSGPSRRVAGATVDEDLRGVWQAQPATDASMRLIFGSHGGRGRDHAGLWIVPTARGELTSTSFEFRVREVERDYDPPRFHLDLMGLERGALAGKTMYGLLEFMDDREAFRLDMEAGEPGEEGVRPRIFTHEAVVFRRVGVGE